MTIVKPCHWFLLWASLLSLGLGVNSGCAALPNVTEKIEETPAAQQPLQIGSSKGLLSTRKSQAIMARLQQSVDPTDILGRHTAVVESVTDSPLTKGNKVTLLADGQATYAAMFKALENAKDHVNPISTWKAISSKTMRPDANLPICCCKSRRQAFRSI